jgi:hypothetical protein
MIITRNLPQAYRHGEPEHFESYPIGGMSVHIRTASGTHI